MVFGSDRTREQVHIDAHQRDDLRSIEGQRSRHSRFQPATRSVRRMYSLASPSIESRRRLPRSPGSRPVRPRTPGKGFHSRRRPRSGGKCPTPDPPGAYFTIAFHDGCDSISWTGASFLVDGGFIHHKTNHLLGRNRFSSYQMAGCAWKLKSRKKIQKVQKN